MKITITRETARDGFSESMSHKKRKSLIITVTGLPQDTEAINSKVLAIGRIASLCENAPETPPDVLAGLRSIKEISSGIIESLTV